MNKLFKNILLVLNEKQCDKEIIRYAIELAKTNNSSIKIIKVIDNLSKLIGMSRSLLHGTIDIKNLIINDLEKTVANSIKRSEHNLKITYKLLDGTAFIEIIREVKRYKHDLVLASSNGNNNLDSRSINSTSFHLLRKCPCPVWVVKPSKKMGYRHILATVDLDSDDDVKSQLNEKIMEAALTLAHQHKSDLHVFYAWQVYGESALRNSPFIKIKKGELNKIIKDEKMMNITKMQNFIKNFPDKRVIIHPELHKGAPVKLIPNFIKKNRIDLVVMGTVCRVGIPGLIIGNTAEEILGAINCSALTIKPDGFVSPVE